MTGCKVSEFRFQVIICLQNTQNEIVQRRFEMTVMLYKHCNGGSKVVAAIFQVAQRHKFSITTRKGDASMFGARTKMAYVMTAVKCDVIIQEQSQDKLLNELPAILPCLRISSSGNKNYNIFYICEGLWLQQAATTTRCFPRIFLSSYLRENLQVVINEENSVSYFI